MPYVAAGAAAVVLLALVLTWLLWPTAEPTDITQNQPQTTTTTSIPETTTTIPEVPVDPHAEQIAAAVAALDAVEATLASKPATQPPLFSARNVINRIIKEHIAPILAVDATHAQALNLEARAKERLAETRTLIAALAPKKTEDVIKAGPDDVQPRPGESPTQWDLRNKEAKSDYEVGRRLIKEGDYLAAVKIWADLNAREPGWRDVSTYLKNAQDGLQQERQRVLNEGLTFEGRGHKAGEAGNYTTAATELIAARKAFERAAQLQAVEAEKYLKDNLARRRSVGQSLLNFANTYASRRNSAEAVRHFQLVIDLLPAGDPIRQQAEAGRQKLSPEFDDRGMFDFAWSD
jgi:hypothetical protein